MFCCIPNLSPTENKRAIISRLCYTKKCYSTYTIALYTKGFFYVTYDLQFILYMSNSSMWRYWVYFLLAHSFIISDCISQIELGKVCIWYGFTYLFFSPALFIFNQCRKQCDDKCVCIAILYQVYQRCFLSTKAMENN